MAEVRVLVVGSDPLARSGIAAMLADRPGIAVAGAAADAEDVVGVAESSRADVVVWDLGTDLPLAIERLSAAVRALAPVVALLGDASAAAQAWAAGARGLLHRDTPPERLAAAVVAVAEGATVLDDDAADALLRRAAPGAGPVEPLTPRELGVLRLLAEGLPNKAVAAQLEVTENTVKFHVNAIFGKLGVQSRTEAVVRATRLGLIPL
ncbi:MAG: response regulator transcription factor [Chloroflexi bacterium]|nr:response regulator transcription factor [Chloroflexota bacterium]